MTATATILEFPRPEGRPSNAALQFENRTLRAALESAIEERDEMLVELQAQTTERHSFASCVLALARRGQMAMSAGYRPAHILLDLERAALREQNRAAAMRPDMGGAA